jgi:glycine cleavage system H protein
MADESYPRELRYHKEHEWARIEGGEAVFGVTWFAQDSLGEIVYASLPEAGATVAAGASYGELESVKAVTDVYAPLSGEVVDSNADLEDEPQLVNDDCYGRGWLIRVRLTNPAEGDGLLDAEGYRKLLEEA